MNEAIEPAKYRVQLDTTNESSRDRWYGGKRQWLDHGPRCFDTAEEAFAYIDEDHKRMSWPREDYRVMQGSKVIERPTSTPVDSKIAAAADKTPYDMIDMRALAGLSRVFQSGAKKHGHTNFLNGTDDGAPHRYMGALYRHMNALQAPGGKFTWESLCKLDDETGLPEIDHALCSLIMLRALLIQTGRLPADPGKGKNLK